MKIAVLFFLSPCVLLLLPLFFFFNVFFISWVRSSTKWALSIFPDLLITSWSWDFCEKETALLSFFLKSFALFWLVGKFWDFQNSNTKQSKIWVRGRKKSKWVITQQCGIKKKLLRSSKIGMALTKSFSETHMVLQPRFLPFFQPSCLKYSSFLVNV